MLIRARRSLHLHHRGRFSGVLIGLAVFLLVIAILPMIRSKRDEVFVEKRGAERSRPSSS